MNLSIRSETPDDRRQILTVLTAAFDQPSDAGEEPPEVALTSELLTGPDYLPELSLVAEIGGAVVGYVISTRGWIGSSPSLGLGPLGVDPEVQKRGVGTALMQETISRAEALGETSIALLGDPDFYRRFGFAPASASGVAAPDPSWGDYFMIRALDGARIAQGTFTYARPFKSL